MKGTGYFLPLPTGRMLTLAQVRALHAERERKEVTKGVQVGQPRVPQKTLRTGEGPMLTDDWAKARV